MSNQRPPTSETSRSVIEVRDLRKSFVRRHGERIVPVDGVSFSVEAGEFVVLLGPSGCGKTTLLRCIAGLEHPDEGDIDLSGTCVYSSARRVALPPERRSASVVFQSYALWPHLTVRRNVAYPLRRSGLPRDEVRDRVDRVLSMVGVGHLAEQHPGQLSGGQQQRVALARALAAGNEVILFDEPLSNVDAKVRDQLRVELLAMQADLGFAALYVTHDQTEAMELGHRIAVLRDGRIEQLDAPAEVYRRPANQYVANFVGRANQLGGVVESVGADGTVEVTTPIGAIRAVGGPVVAEPGTPVVVIVRPESIRLSDAPGAGPNRWQGEVTGVVFGGPQVRVDLSVGGHHLEVWAPSSGRVPAVGDDLALSVPEPECWTLPQGTPGPLATGSPVVPLSSRA